MAEGEDGDDEEDEWTLEDDVQELDGRYVCCKCMYVRMCVHAAQDARQRQHNGPHVHQSTDILRSIYIYNYIYTSNVLISCQPHLPSTGIVSICIRNLIMSLQCAIVKVLAALAV